MNKTKNITNETVTAYINSFYRPVNDALMQLRLAAEAEDIPIILRESEDFLRVLLTIHKPTRILEIGTAVGYSAAFFAAVTGATVLTVEMDEAMAGRAKENLRQMGVLACGQNDSGMVQVLTGDGADICHQLTDCGMETFDLVFIDAAKSHYRRFLDAAMPLTHAGTLIVSDNVLFRARVASDLYDPNGKHKTNIRKLREYVDYIYQHSRLDTTVIACGDGLAISRVKE